MPNLNNWLFAGEAIDAESRAVDAWNRIQRNPTEITVERRGEDNVIQTVRIEFDNTATESVSKSSGITASRPATVFGVIGHPDVSVIDTDLSRGAIFKVTANNQLFRITDVQQLLGEIQARAEVTG